MIARVVPSLNLFVVICGKTILIYHSTYSKITHLDKVKDINELVGGLPPEAAKVVVSAIKEAQEAGEVENITIENLDKFS